MHFKVMRYTASYIPVNGRPSPDDLPAALSYPVPELDSRFANRLSGSGTGQGGGSMEAVGLSPTNPESRGGIVPIDLRLTGTVLFISRAIYITLVPGLPSA